MHPRERVLQKAALLTKTGRPIPLDLATEAMRLGIELSAVCPNHFKQTIKETEQNVEQTNIHD